MLFKKDYRLPDVIELMVLKNEKEIEVLINPLISPYQNKAMEPPEGQIASAKMDMAKLSSQATLLGAW